jgi:hypothetical protein
LRSRIAREDFRIARGQHNKTPQQRREKRMQDLDSSSHFRMAMRALGSIEQGTPRDRQSARNQNHRTRARAWIRVCGFVVLWVLAAGAVDALSGSSVIATLVGLWIAANGTLFVFAVEAWKLRRFGHSRYRGMALR